MQWDWIGWMLIAFACISIIVLIIVSVIEFSSESEDDDI